MKLIDLDQRVIVPVVDESRGGMRYEMEMSLGEMLGRALEDFEPEIVEAVPVVHARWIEVDEGDGDYTYDCSACGGKWWLAADTPEVNGMKYCPYCGAKMDGRQMRME